MAFAPSQPENIGEREFSIIADGLFNGELDERAARLAQQEREQQREFSLLADEVERMRLFNEELDLRAERMDQRARHLAHAMEMRAAELDTREQQLWDEQEAFRAEKESAEASLLSERREFEEYAHSLQQTARETERGERELWEARRAAIDQRESACMKREMLQNRREVDLGRWQSRLEGREDELATAQAQLSEEREAFERRARRAEELELLNSPPLSGDF